MKYFYWAVICLFLLGCAGEKQQREIKEVEVKGNIYTVETTSPIVKEVKTNKVALTSVGSSFKVAGTVRAITGRIAEVAVPFDGRIVASTVRLGQKVGAGTLLFKLNSADFYNVSKAFFQTKQNRALAKRNYERKKELHGGGIVSKRDLEEAETEYRNAQAEYDEAVASMKVFNVRADQLTSVGQPLPMVSPIAGEVVKCNVTIGEYVKSDDEAVVTVADLSKVWVVAHVKENYCGAVKPDDIVEVVTDAQPEKTISGKVYYIGELMDEETRAVEVLVECDNSSRELKPGMFATVKFQSTARDAIILPATAILQNEEQPSVFVVQKEGVYECRPVSVATTEEGKIWVTQGLKPGETVVVNGGIFLNK